VGAVPHARLLRGRAELSPERIADGGARPPLRPAGGEEALRSIYPPRSFDLPL
jgi:hypothetical protein